MSHSGPLRHYSLIHSTSPSSFFFLITGDRGNGVMEQWLIGFSGTAMTVPDPEITVEERLQLLPVSLHSQGWVVRVELASLGRAKFGCWIV